MKITSCRECSAAMGPATSSGRRSPPGHLRRHRARGLCELCYDHLRRYVADGLADYERRSRSADEVLGEWALLRDDGYGVRLAAERMGVTFAALDRALCRAKRRGDPRGSRVPFAHDMGRSA